MKNICEPKPPLRLLRGVTRTVTLAIYGSDGETPIDLTGVALSVTVSRDNSNWHYEPTVQLDGEDNNLVVLLGP